MRVSEEQQGALTRPSVTGDRGESSDKARHARTSHLTDSANTTPTPTTAEITATTPAAAVASPLGPPRPTTIASNKGAVHVAMNGVEPADHHVCRSGTMPVRASGTSRASSVAAAASSSSRRTSAGGSGAATRKAPSLGRGVGRGTHKKQQSVGAMQGDSDNQEEGGTFRYQSRLPKLEVPPLEETLNRYLGAVAPLLSPQAFSKTKAIVEEVRGMEGRREEATLGFCFRGTPQILLILL